MKRIIKSQDCQKCKYSLFDDEYEYSEPEPDDDSEVCKSCLSRTYRLGKIIENYENERNQFINQRVITEDVILLRSLIIKIQRKIYEKIKCL